MAVGSVQNIIVCVPSARNRSVAPCVDIAGSVQEPVMQTAYVIDPVYAAHFDTVALPFDYAYAGALFTLAFTSVVGLFLVARSAGVVLEFIRRG